MEEGCHKRDSVGGYKRRKQDMVSGVNGTRAGKIKNIDSGFRIVYGGFSTDETTRGGGQFDDGDY